MAHNGSRMCDTMLSVNSRSSERAAFLFGGDRRMCVIGFTFYCNFVG